MTLRDYGLGYGFGFGCFVLINRRPIAKIKMFTFERILGRFELVFFSLGKTLLEFLVLALWAFQPQLCHLKSHSYYICHLNFISLSISSFLTLC